MFTRHLILPLSLCLAGTLGACAPAATAAPTAAAYGYAPTAAPAATSAPAATAAAGYPAGDRTSVLPPASQMIIKNADMELLVPDSKQALTQITLMAAADGGYVISSQTWLDGSLEHATLQMAIPSTQFEQAMNTLRNLGKKVLKETTSGQDVSAEYTDLQSRLNNLEATSARVRTFLDESKTVEDSLNVNGQLSQLEGQIEQIKGQMKYYEGRSAFSVITVTLTPVVPEATPTPEPAWSPAVTFHRATNALSQMLKTSTDVLIWLAVLTSPLTIALGLILIGRWLLVRRPRARA